MIDVTRKLGYKFLRNDMSVKHLVPPSYDLFAISLRKIVTHFYFSSKMSKRETKRESDRQKEFLGSLDEFPENSEATGVWETTRCRQFSRYVINVGDTMCREFVTASAIARDILPRSSRTTSLRCCTPIRGKLIVTISLSGAQPLPLYPHKGDASSAVARCAAILPSPT